MTSERKPSSLPSRAHRLLMETSNACIHTWIYSLMSGSESVYVKKKANTVRGRQWWRRDLAARISRQGWYWPQRSSNVIYLTQRRKLKAFGKPETSCGSQGKFQQRLRAVGWSQQEAGFPGKAPGWEVKRTICSAWHGTTRESRQPPKK